MNFILRIFHLKRVYMGHVYNYQRQICRVDYEQYCEQQAGDSVMQFSLNISVCIRNNRMKLRTHSSCAEQVSAGV